MKASVEDEGSRMNSRLDVENYLQIAEMVVRVELTGEAGISDSYAREIHFVNKGQVAEIFKVGKWTATWLLIQKGRGRDPIQTLGIVFIKDKIPEWH